jgi:arabinose-5-phosphate isomerase
MGDRLKLNWVASGRLAIEAEAHALQLMAEQLDDSFNHAVHTVLSCTGKVVMCGIGKSGHIGRKIASTFASTGTPAIYLHPSEASHGDLGVIERRDVVIGISRSGESLEMNDVLTYCKRFGIPLIAITGVAESTLARSANIVLKLPKLAEVCPLGLAPTTSTTLTLAMGDALAVACIEARGFDASAFREFHPGGKLGKKLLRVKDAMHSGDELPLVLETASVREAVIEMSRGRFGCVGVLGAQRELVGIFTDGDLRRNFAAEILSDPIAQHMYRSPHRISPDELLADAVNLMNKNRIPSLFVVQTDTPVGIIHLHDILASGVV